MVLMLITCVLDVLMVSPVCFAYISNLSVFSCKWSRFTDRNARSSAKLRSSYWEKRVHWIPLGLSDVVFRIIQSMMTKKRMGERIHPCLTFSISLGTIQRIYYCIQSGCRTSLSVNQSVKGRRTGGINKPC